MWLADPLSLGNLLADVDWAKVPIWKISATAAAGCLATQVLRFINMSIIQPARTPLRKLPGPPDSQASFLWGHMKLTWAGEPNAVQEEWFEEYGPSISYRGILGSRRLCTKDPRAVTHVFVNGYDYPKPAFARNMLMRIFGNGALFAEGDSHRRQKKLLSPCFSPARIRDLMPIIYEKTTQLCGIWHQELRENNGEKEIDVLPWLTRAMLDVIGSAGFDYHFNSLRDGEKNELVRAFLDLFSPSQSLAIVHFLSSRFPILAYIPTERGKTVRRSREVMARVADQLFREKKAAVLAASTGSRDKNAVVGSDLLSILVQANMAADVKDRLTDDEVKGQLSTLFIAGHETTSTSLSWLLYDLAKPKHLQKQERLRAELLSVSSPQPGMDELNALPYLDAMIRETMRINSPVDSTVRCAGKDDVIPVSKPYIDTDGVERYEIRINKGDEIFIPVIAMHRDPEIWGEDALEFKPERWLKPGGRPYTQDLPGVYSNVLTFIGGPRACMGYRLAVMEMKVAMFEIIRNFTVSLPGGAESLEIGKRANIVTRPIMKQPDGTLKSMMPLVLKPVNAP